MRTFRPAQAQIAPVHENPGSAHLLLPDFPHLPPGTKNTVMAAFPTDFILPKIPNSVRFPNSWKGNPHMVPDDPIVTNTNNHPEVHAIRNTG